MVKRLAETAHIIEEKSENAVEFLKIRSVVRSLKQIVKSTAIDSDGMNFSIKEKKSGDFRFEKIKNGKNRRANIIIPIAIVAISASVEVSFIGILHFCFVWRGLFENIFLSKS